MTVSQFKREHEKSSHILKNALFVTTSTTSLKLANILPPGFFTHILLDEGTQSREPEGIAPLCMAVRKTKIVIAGDSNQVGPSMTVLGEEARQNGLAVSLMERLENHYYNKEVGKTTNLKHYCTKLNTNYRCHKDIMGLAERLFYTDIALKCAVPSNSTHPDAPYPLVFVCSSIDDTVQTVNDSTNEDEAKIVLEQLAKYSANWPVHGWGPKDLSKTCIISPTRSQLTAVNRLHMNLREYYRLKDTRKLPTYDIQGREFRAIFLSTSEPTWKDGASRNPTKSICDPYIFNTAITRAQSLVVSVGNPFVLLREEQHMIERYGNRGSCWSTYLQFCLEHNTLSIDKSLRISRGEEERLFEKLEELLYRKLPRPLTHSSPQDVEDKLLTEPKVAVLNNKLNQEYEVKECLGKGRSGIVYCVRKKSDDKDCALKIMKLPDDESDRTRLIHEISVLTKLEHPRLVYCFQSWLEESSSTIEGLLPSKEPRSRATRESYLLIQMQLCKKETLKDWLQKNNSREKRRVLGFFRQILDALMFMHQKRLIHRNLKPSNVLFSQEDGSIKVGDFCIFHNGNSQNSTRFYMAPEQLAGREYDEKVDIFALGVIFFELYCPFASETERDKVLTAVTGGQIPPHFTLHHSREARFVESLLSPQPSMRPSTKTTNDLFHEMRQALHLTKPAHVPKYDKVTEISHTAGREIFTHDTEQEYLDAKLGREYELKEVLGKGSFGVVFHVKNKLDDGEYALKIIKLPNDKEKQDKMKHEVHVLVKLDHPKIVRYFQSWRGGLRGSEKLLSRVLAGFSKTSDSGYPFSPPTDTTATTYESSEPDHPNCLFIQLELCSKTTLKKWLEENVYDRGRKRVLYFFEQILDAVMYIHQKGFFHQDLKPSNIFFSQEDSLKVGDLGLAVEEVPSLTVESREQRLSSRAITNFYRAPEQRAGGNYDNKVDIFALGVIFFELNCPFSDEEERHRVLTDIRNGKFHPNFIKVLCDEAKFTNFLLSTEPLERPSTEEAYRHIPILQQVIDQSQLHTVPKLPLDELDLHRPVLKDPLETAGEKLCHFVGKLRQESVTADGQVITWPDIGIEFDIPPRAVPKGQLLDLEVQPCLGGPFVLPEDHELASAVYIISPAFKFTEEVHMSIFHWIDLQNEDDCKDMSFISAPSLPTYTGTDLSPAYKFRCLDKGRFQKGSRLGCITLKHFCLAAIGRKLKHPSTPDGATSKKKKDNLLYSVQLHQTSDLALFSVTMCHPVYEKNLQLFLEQQRPGTTFASSTKAPVRFLGSKVSLSIPPDDTHIVPDRKPCEISEEEVNLPVKKRQYAKISRNYPPKIWLRSLEAPRCQTTLGVLGLTEELEFTWLLQNKPAGMVAQVQRADILEKQPSLKRLQLLKRQDGEEDISILNEAAIKWKDLGLALGFHYHELIIIDDKCSDARECILDLLGRWLRKPCTWRNLVEALKDVGLHNLANKVESALPSTYT